MVVTLIVGEGLGEDVGRVVLATAPSNVDVAILLEFLDLEVASFDVTVTLSDLVVQFGGIR